MHTHFIAQLWWTYMSDDGGVFTQHIQTDFSQNLILLDGWLQVLRWLFTLCKHTKYTQHRLFPCRQMSKHTRTMWTTIFNINLSQPYPNRNSSCPQIPIFCTHMRWVRIPDIHFETIHQILLRHTLHPPSPSIYISPLSLNQLLVQHDAFNISLNFSSKWISWMYVKSHSESK